MPIPSINNNNKLIALEMKSLTDQILDAKKQNLNAGTKNFEQEIDKLVYKLYDLTDEKIKVIEGRK